MGIIGEDLDYTNYLVLVKETNQVALFTNGTSPGQQEIQDLMC